MSGHIKLDGVDGYLVRPSGIDRWPAVIVIHEWWGLDNQTESITDRIGEAGYLAFAPDLFNGELAQIGDVEKASSLVEKYSESASTILESAFDALKKHPDSTGKVGAVGFSFGGRMALSLSIARPLDAVCTLYGGGMQQVFDKLSTLKSPVLGLFGDKDQSIPTGTIEEFDKLLDKVDVTHEVVVYPDSGHAFFRDRDPNTYKPEAAKDAWERMIKFFSKNLIQSK